MGITALFGAGGAIGESVAAALRARGSAYRVVGRSRGSLHVAFGTDPDAQIVTWDPDQPASIRAAARGVDTLIYLVGVPYTDFRLHPILMHKTIEAAIAEGVQRIILVGTVYPYGLPQSNPVREGHPRLPHTFKGQMRKAQEDLLLAADAAGKVRGLILRLPDFYGPNVERSFLHDAFRAALDKRRARMIGPLDVEHEFIFTPDVGPILLDLAERPEAYGRAWHLSGPGTITQRRMAELIFAGVGRRPRVRAAGRLTLRTLGLFKPMLREIAEMHYLFTTPVIMDDSALRSLLGPIHKTSYEDGVRLTLFAMKKGTRR